MKRLKEWFQLFNIVVAGVFVVWGCIMIISYYHAWELYSNVGDFPGKLAHVAVVAFDTVFAISVLVFSLKTIKQVENTDDDWRVWFGLGFGFLVTAWSNIRASMKDEWILFITNKWGQISANGWESLMAGLTTPLSLLAVEFMLVWMVTNRHLFVGKNDTTNTDDNKVYNNDKTGSAAWSVNVGGYTDNIATTNNIADKMTEATTTNNVFLGSSGAEPTTNNNTSNKDIDNQQHDRNLAETGDDPLNDDTNNNDNQQQHEVDVAETDNDDTNKEGRNDNNLRQQHANNTTTTEINNSMEKHNANDNNNDNNKAKTNNDNNKRSKVVDMSERRNKRKELDRDTVIKIFLAEGSNAQIAKRFGVSAEAVRKIKNGERHAEVTAPYRQAK